MIYILYCFTAFHILYTKVFSIQIYTALQKQSKWNEPKNKSLISIKTDAKKRETVRRVVTLQRLTTYWLLCAARILNSFLFAHRDEIVRRMETVCYTFLVKRFHTEFNLQIAKPFLVITQVINGIFKRKKTITYVGERIAE